MGPTPRTPKALVYSDVSSDSNKKEKIFTLKPKKQIIKTPYRKTKLKLKILDPKQGSAMPDSNKKIKKLKMKSNKQKKIRVPLECAKTDGSNYKVNLKCYSTVCRVLIISVK